MCILSISNQKGGVAKTTTAHNLGAGLCLIGHKVLLIDLDPQANLSSVCGINNADKNIYNVLKKEIELQEIIINVQENLDIAPSNILLSGLEMELTQTGKEYRLKEAIESIKANYDYIIVDTPPSLSTLTINAFTASDYVIIPTTASIFSIAGVSQLYNTIKEVQKYTNNTLKIAGILITQFNARTNVSKEIEEFTNKLADSIDAKVFNTTISLGTAINESQLSSLDIYSHNKRSKVAIEYISFVKELMETIK